jgi:hypothetical protein
LAPLLLKLGTLDPLTRKSGKSRSRLDLVSPTDGRKQAAARRAKRRSQRRPPWPTIPTLIDSGIEVLFGDMPEVTGAMGRFILVGMVNVAELEGRRIYFQISPGLGARRR